MFRQTFLQGEQESIWGVAGGPQIWSILGPMLPQVFFLWLKADKDRCGPSGYQDNHGNPLVSYSALFPTRNGKEEKNVPECSYQNRPLS